MSWHFDRILERGQADNPNWEIETRLYMSYWYGGLYVVIEGWRELELTDESVDRLLESPNVDLLRRFRNGTYHFQKQYFDSRFLDLIVEGENVVQWVRGVREAFSQFFLNWSKQQSGKQQEHGETA